MIIIRLILKIISQIEHECMEKRFHKLKNILFPNSTRVKETDYSQLFTRTQ